jgi:hypothetical protein
MCGTKFGERRKRNEHHKLKVLEAQKKNLKILERKKFNRKNLAKRFRV